MPDGQYPDMSRPSDAWLEMEAERQKGRSTRSTEGGLGEQVERRTEEEQN